MGGKIFTASDFTQHTDMSISMLEGMVRKVNHTIPINGYCNKLVMMSNGDLVLYIFRTPKYVRLFARNTADDALAYDVIAINISDSNTIVKYQILKQGLNIKIEKV